MSELDLREQIVRIDHMLADHQRIYADMRRIDADRDRKRQEIKLAPWALVITGMTAGAAFFGAGFALAKLFGSP
jgi:hypothetical protein